MNNKKNSDKKIFSTKILSSGGVKLYFSFYGIEYIPSKEEINGVGFDPWLIISVKGEIGNIDQSNYFKFSSNIQMLFSEVQYFINVIKDKECKLDFTKNDINFYSNEYETIEPWFKLHKSIVHDLSKNLIFTNYKLSFDNEYGGMFGLCNINVDIDNDPIDNKLYKFFDKINLYINKKYKEYIK